MKSFLSLLSVILLFTSCEKDSNDHPAGAWSNSVFIINEGPYPTGSGTISAFNRETLEVTDDLFGTANGRPLGNVVQSLTVHGDKAYIVVNNANKIEVVNLEDFKSVASIENLVLPRYFVAPDDLKGYVSCWDSTVKVVNLADYSIINSIKVGTGPDELITVGNYLFVINTGGFGTDSTLSVINMNSGNLLESLVVGHRPVGMQVDENGNVWVLCAGKGWNGFPALGDTPGRLVCISPSNLSILKEFTFPDSENHPDNLIINKEGNTLFYNYPRGIHAFSISATALNEHPAILVNETIYGMGFDKDVSMIYVTYPLDYLQNGWIYRFREQDGAEVDSFPVGIIPNGFCFNN
jgi:hypothetical protein